MLPCEDMLEDDIAWLAVEAGAGALVSCANAGRENATATSAGRMSLRMNATPGRLMSAPPRWRARIIRRRGKRELNSFRTRERRAHIDGSAALRHAARLIHRTTESHPCRFPPATTLPTSRC